MNDITNKIKIKNNASYKKSGKMLIYVEILFISVAIILLVIDLETFMTITVLLIFFSLVMGIISLFLAFLNLSKKIEIKIANSVDIGYSTFIQRYNLSNDTDYTIQSDVKADDVFYLVPSFSNKSVNYLIKNQDIKLYHCEVFNKIGAEQRRTYYFKGLYMIINGIKGDAQFRMPESISGKLIESFKHFYKDDLFDISNYKYDKEYKEGMLYNNTKEHPSKLDDMISLLQQIDFIKSFRIGMKNNELHIAITQDHMRLPYVKKYNDDEIEDINKVVNENLDLIESIKNLL